MQVKTQLMTFVYSFVVCLLLTNTLVADKVLAEGQPATHTLQSPDQPTRTILKYIAGYVPSPNPKKPYYGRSGFIHPVLTPSGRMLTDDFPKNHHTHQHALMYAWTYTKIDGRKVDFWNSHHNLGKVEHVKTLLARPDRIESRLNHIDLTGDSPEVVIKENWVIQAVKDETFHVFDLESTHIAMKLIELPEYRYGGMCIRGSHAWANGANGIKMTTSENMDRIKGNHTRPKWVAIHGKIGGEACGLAVMGHSSNFRHPQPVRLHPKMPYFCFSPQVAGDFALSPERPYTSRYRFIAFDGELDHDAINARWQRWQKVK